jgi:type I restriction enzyme, S subunit
VEPASELLKRIRIERRKKWEQAELAKLKAKGKTPTDDKWMQKYVEPEPVDDSDMPELPEGWVWASLGDLGADPFNAVQTGPFGAMLHNDEFVDDGVPVIAVGNLTGMGFRREGAYFITPQKARELNRFDVQAGDVLFARSGATLGKVCVAPKYVKDWRMTGHILRLRLNEACLRPELAVFALAGAPAVQGQVTDGVRGVTRPGYNTSLLEAICVPIPPRGEQDALITLVSSYLALLEARSKHLDEMGNGLLQLDSAILSKAFRGELVPQDPNDAIDSVPDAPTIKSVPSSTQTKGSTTRTRSRVRR